MKIQTIKLKRFGKIEEKFTSDFKREIWSCKFGNDFEEPKNSGIIMRFAFYKEDYPNKNKIPLYKHIGLVNVEKKEKKTNGRTK
jgi:hypothetical protein